MTTPTLRDLPLAEVVESPRNARRHFDPSKLDELAASMQSEGQLTPCLVRPSADLGGYELAAGHRRRRAAEMAGLATLLCLVRDMTDEEFLRTLVRENQDREDLHPLDEALGFQQLLDLPGYDVAAVAATLGKSASYVYGRLHLAHLIPKAQEWFLAGKFPVSHALLIARGTPDQQEIAIGSVLDWNGEPKSYDRFRDDLGRQFHVDLKGAPWKLDDATLLPAAGACLTCPKRSGTLPDLFHDIRGANTCTDASCHGAKLRAHVARSLAEAEAAGSPLVQITARYSDRLPAPGKPVPPKWWAEAKKKDAGAVRAIDTQTGKVTYVTLSLPKDLEKARKRQAERRVQQASAPAARDDAKGKAIAERESAFRRHAATEMLANRSAITRLDPAATLWSVVLVVFDLGAALDLDYREDAVAAELLGWPTPPTEHWKREARAEWIAQLSLDTPDLRTLFALVLSGELEVNHHHLHGTTVPDAPAFAWVAGLVGYDLAEARRNWDAANPTAAPTRPAAKGKTAPSRRHGGATAGAVAS